MYNYIFLIGRLVRDVEPNKYKDNHSIGNVCLAVPRPFKNPETSTIDTDFINVTAFEPTCDNIKEYCKKGDVVGIKGRIQTKTIVDKDGNNITVPDIIAERVVFIPSNKKAED